eukprot:6192944-Pleurochrysis_carterae.AAC.1
MSEHSASGPSVGMPELLKFGFCDVGVSLRSLRAAMLSGFAFAGLMQPLPPEPEVRSPPATYSEGTRTHITCPQDVHAHGACMCGVATESLGAARHVPHEHRFWSRIAAGDCGAAARPLA